MKMEGTKIVYEVGDWVFGWHTKENDYYAQAWQIGSFDREFVYPKCHPDWNTEVHNLRPATQEEINTATEEEKIMIGEYEVDFGNARGDQLDFIKIGCVKVNKELYIETGKKAGWL